MSITPPITIPLQVLVSRSYNNTQDFTLHALIDWSNVPAAARQPAPVNLPISIVGPSSIAFRLPKELSVQIDNTQCASGVYVYAPNTMQGIYVAGKRRKRVSMVGNFAQGFQVIAVGEFQFGITSIIVSTNTDATWDDIVAADMTGSNGFNPSNTTSAKGITTSVDLSQANTSSQLAVPGYTLLGYGVELVGVSTGVGGANVELFLIGDAQPVAIINGVLTLPASLTQLQATMTPFMEYDGLSYSGNLIIETIATTPATKGAALVTVKYA